MEKIYIELYIIFWAASLLHFGHGGSAKNSRLSAVWLISSLLNAVIIPGAGRLPALNVHSPQSGLCVLGAPLPSEASRLLVA